MYIKTVREINLVVFRHNKVLNKETFEKFTKGQHEYQVSARSLTWDEQDQTEKVETREISFKSDLPETLEIIEEIIIAFYWTLDYPEYTELLDYKVINLDKSKNELDTVLKQYGDNKCYANEYTKSPEEYIQGRTDEDSKTHTNKCVHLLIWQFWKLTERVKHLRH